MATPNLAPFFSSPATPSPKLFLVRRRALEFLPCQNELPGFGPCDAQPCGRRAVASSVPLQIPVCPSCLRKLEAEGL